MRITCEDTTLNTANAITRLAASVITVGLLLPYTPQAGEASALPDFKPVPPAIKARILPVDPKKGYLVKELKPDVYLISDGGYQSVFVTTGKGVILLDAPPSFGTRIVRAVSEVTSEPIVDLVYSHSHLDHISGAADVLKEVPNIKIISEEGVAKFLREKKDPRRPIPTETFKDHYTLTLGSATIEMKHGHWHSNEGDLYIYLPAKKVLMAIDTLPPGYAQFMDIDLTSDFRDYLAMFDKVLAYDFDLLVGGHLGFPGTRNDVQVAKEYTMDVYKTVKRIHDGTDQVKVVTEAAAKYGWDNKMALFRGLLDPIMDECAKEITTRWSDRLASVDVYARTHCHTALIYARWDD
jgi:glyoxylase-like metal-dependent hydrolase (beta-lactamase superfamily II)